jgi:acyl-CoA synthetase (NDP forming)
MNSKISDSLNALFYPKNLAIYEASEKLWYFLMGLEELQFDKNKLYLISPNKEEITGIKCYKSLKDVPEKSIDHLILSVGRNRILESVKMLLSQKEIKSMHIFTAGMGESDKEGEKIEKELHNLLKNNNNNHNTRAIGPNCMGVYSTKGHLAYEPLFPKEPGNISLVFQSGDLHSQMIRLSSIRHNLRFSKGVSVGNCLDLQIADFLEYYNTDEETELILVYFEGFNSLYPNEGKRLLNILKNMNKPVLFMNGGSTERSQTAALSHTGSIGTSQKIWKAIYRKTPIIEVPTCLDDMIDYTYLFSNVIDRYKRNDRIITYPKGKNALIILWSGGFGISATNTLTQMGINVPLIEGKSLEELREIYPVKIGSLSNPIDLPWISSSDKYLKVALKAITEDTNLVMILTDAWEDFEGKDRFQSYYNNLKSIRDHTESMDNIFTLILPYYPARRRRRYYNKLMEDKFIVYPSFRRAAKAFSALYEYGRKIEVLRKE